MAITAVTLTLNPCVDRTVWLPSVTLGELNRVKRSRVDYSGKGVNVAKALHGWGRPVVAVGILAGETGRRIEADLNRTGIDSRFLYVPGESRTNIKLIDEASGSMTEINEAGVPVDPETLSQLVDLIAPLAAEARFLVLSGSLPPGVPAEYYADLIRQVGARTHVVLDTSGEALRRGIRARPAMVKPNQAEAKEWLGTPLEGPEDWVSACRAMQRHGVEWVILSLGADGAVFASERDGLWWARSEPVVVRSLAGCGDTLVAAAIMGEAEGWRWSETAAFAVAAATVAATLEGTTFPERDQVERAVGAVTLERLD